MDIPKALQGGRLEAVSQSGRVGGSLTEWLHSPLLAGPPFSKLLPIGAAEKERGRPER